MTNPEHLKILHRGEGMEPMASSQLWRKAGPLRGSSR